MCSSPRQSPETGAGHRAAANTCAAPLSRVRKQGPATARRLIHVQLPLTESWNTTWPPFGWYMCSSPKQSPETGVGQRAAADTCATLAPQTGRDETHSVPCWQAAPTRVRCSRHRRCNCRRLARAGGSRPGNRSLLNTWSRETTGGTWSPTLAWAERNNGII